MFLEAFFSHSRKLFSKFPYKIFVIALHEIIGLQNFSLSFCKSKSRITMCNLHWCYTFCTGVTLFALVLHLNCTALSQSESSNFFMCIINPCNSFQFVCFILMSRVPLSSRMFVISAVAVHADSIHVLYGRLSAAGVCNFWSDSSLGMVKESPNILS